MSLGPRFVLNWATLLSAPPQSYSRMFSELQYRDQATSLKSGDDVSDNNKKSSFSDYHVPSTVLNT